MPKDNTPTDADVIFNRANVALAHSQRLVQSWLPTKTSQDAQPEKTHQELLKEDEELFKPTPELLGLGASAPDPDQDPLLKQRHGANYDRLLEQLLGKKAARGHRATSKPQPGQKTPASQKTTSDQPAVDDHDDDDEGRAAMVASNSALKRKGPSHTSTRKLVTTSQNKLEAESLSDDDDDPRPSKKRSGTYLDQLLAEKASKKKRKQQKS
ncbi:hypothetical protein E4T50_16537 [Aureobasidium sp. EXF-12298]|nr:hypothetical protein E4T50_16537 [Aureobasidium sp. EXF-12298]